jgi:hypothetical protein
MSLASLSKSEYNPPLRSQANNPSQHVRRTAMSLKTLLGTALLVSAVISSNPAQAIDVKSIDLDALKADAAKYGVECDTSTPARIMICSKRVSNAKLDVDIFQKKVELARLRAENERLKTEGKKIDEETLEKVRDLQDFVNKEGKYKK